MLTSITQPTKIPFAPILEKLQKILVQYPKNSAEDWAKHDTYNNILNAIGTQEFLNTENINKTLQEQGYENIGYTSLTLLKIAILFGSEEVVEELLKYGAEVNIPDPKNQNGWGEYTELHWAAVSGNAKIAQSLLEAQVNPDMKATDGFTPFHIAAERGHIEIAQKLNRAGVDINAQMWSGNTPLHLAVLNNKREMVEYLLSNHANVNLKNYDGKTPLDAAIALRDPGMIRMVTDAELMQGRELTSFEEPTALQPLETFGQEGFPEDTDN